VQRQGQRGLHALLRQALEHPRVTHGAEHQILVADVAAGAQQMDGFQHRIQVVRGLTHAHEHDLVDRPQAARQRHLGHDLGAAQLALQAAGAGHAEHAAHGAADLRADAQTTARQQHAFHGLAVGQRHQQAFGAVVARVARLQLRQTGQFVRQCGQRMAHGQGHEAVQRPFAGVLRQGTCPQPQHTLLVSWVGPQGAQALADPGDVHRQPRSAWAWWRRWSSTKLAMK
jgi:hypothetical protein